MIPDADAPLRPSWLLLGPAFVAAIAYVDPGNVAANVSAGAQFGFLLVWVILVANAMACLVQYLSAKLGLVSGLSLPEAVGQRHARAAAGWRTGCRPNWSQWQPISPRWWAARSRCTSSSTCRCSPAG